jgi:hypothetical protein
VFTAVMMKNVVFWNVTSLALVKIAVVTANVVPSSLILTILMMEAIRSSETSLLTRGQRRHVLEDSILLVISYSKVSVSIFG